MFVIINYKLLPSHYFIKTKH